MGITADPPRNANKDGPSNNGCSNTHPQDDSDPEIQYDSDGEDKWEDIKNRSGSLVYDPAALSGEGHQASHEARTSPCHRSRLQLKL